MELDLFQKMRKRFGAVFTSERHRSRRGQGHASDTCRLRFESLEHRKVLAVISLGTGDGSVTVDVDGYGSFGRDQDGSAEGDATLDVIGPGGSVGTMFESGVAIGYWSGGQRRFLTDGDIGGSGGLPQVPVNVNGSTATSSFTLSGLTGSLTALNGLSVNLTQALTPVLHDGVQIGALLTQTYVMSKATGSTLDFNLVRYADVDNILTASKDGGGRVLVNGQEWLVTTNSEIVSNLNPADFFVAIATSPGSGDVYEPLANRYEVDKFSNLLSKVIAGTVSLNDSVTNDSADADKLIDSGTYDTTGALLVNVSMSPPDTQTFVTYTLFADGVCSPLDLLKPESQRSPRISNVTISGSTSTHAAYSFNGPDDSTDVDGSGQQLVTVPVGGANTVEIQFCEHVTNLQASHLKIQGLLYNTTPTLATNGFSYNPTTHKATWRFNAPFAADQYAISVSDLVTDAQGNRLDGEWTNPKFTSTGSGLVSRFPSGNGTAGGNFSFVVTILPGDADRNNIVNSVDEAILNSYSGWPNPSFMDGDFDGDGDANDSDDADMLWDNWNRNLQGLAWADFSFNGTIGTEDEDIIDGNLGSSVTPWMNGDVNGDGWVTSADQTLYGLQSGYAVRPGFPLRINVAL